MVSVDKDETNNFEYWIEQAMNGELKEAINLFVWRWGHPNLTLAQAERIAITVYNLLSENPKNDNS